VPADERHSHLIAFPEALEALFGRMNELRLLLGPGATAAVGRIEALLRDALAARERGDVPAAVAGITAAMGQLATAANQAFAGEGEAMRALVGQFQQAIGRGSVGDAEQAAETMRERSGSRKIPRKES
jgi:hypothetical protein